LDVTVIQQAYITPQPCRKPMITDLVQLVILFLVIFDPLASLAVFLAASAKMKETERLKTVLYAVLVASALSAVVLVFGKSMLDLFSTTIDEFRIAGGVILSILGVRMAMGYPLMHIDTVKASSARAIAALIGTPLLTGPAAITAIIVSTSDYGKIITGIALLIVLALTTILFLTAGRTQKLLSPTPIQVISTVLGMVTLAWGVRFITIGLRAIMGLS